MLLAVEDVSLSFGGVQGAHRRVVRHPQGRDPRHHRPERRRQDVDAQRHQRLLPSAAGPHHLQGRDAPARCARTRRRAAASPARSRTSRCSGHDRRSTTSWPGRTLKMQRGFFWQLLRYGPALRRGDRASRNASRRSSTFSRSQHIRKMPVGQAALRPAEAGRARPRAGHGAGAPAARRADGRHEPRGEGGHVALHPRREPAVRHHHRADRARHGRGDGPVRPRRRARIRPQDRRRHARRGQARRASVIDAYLGVAH